MIPNSIRPLIAALVLSLGASPAFAAGDPRTHDPWTLARTYLRTRSPAVAERLVAELGGEDREVAARAAKVVRVIGVSEPAAFQALLTHPNLREPGIAAIIRELEQMPSASERRAMLIGIALQIRDARKVAR